MAAVVRADMTSVMVVPFGTLPRRVRIATRVKATSISITPSLSMSPMCAVFGSAESSDTVPAFGYVVRSLIVFGSTSEGGRVLNSRPIGWVPPPLILNCPPYSFTVTCAEIVASTWTLATSLSERAGEPSSVTVSVAR